MYKTYQSGKITSKGQFTFPAPLREHLKLSEGDRLQFTLSDEGEVSVSVIKKKSLLDVVGILKVDGNVDFDESREIAQKFVGDNYKNGDK